MGYEDQLRDIVLSMKGNARGRFVCPVCNGGSNHERSLQVTKVGLRYRCNCYRATCPLTIVHVLGDGTLSSARDTSHPSFVGWEAPTYPLPPEFADELEGSLVTYNVRLTKDDRLVIPVYDHLGARRGDVVRQLKPYRDGLPKSITLTEPDYCGLAWFFPQELSTPYGGESLPPEDFPICVVEDPLSAMRLATHGVVGIALLGAALTTNKTDYIRKVCGNLPVNLALDADAYLFSIKQVRRLYNVLNLRVHRLFNDIKDMDVKSLGNFLGDLVV